MPRGVDGLQASSGEPHADQSLGNGRRAMRRKSIEVMSKERQVELQRYVERSYPIGRVGQPSDLGGIAVFLASQEAAWVTGGVIAVDGGFTAG
jgi:NAD(P)-dependent dehydrogenase (short-subunit alcohol dehydrogenase family)